jgi:hypothetical protein
MLILCVLSAFEAVHSIDGFPEIEGGEERSRKACAPTFAWRCKARNFVRRIPDGHP